MSIPNFVDLLDEILLKESEDKKIKYKDYPYHHNPSSASFKRPSGEVVGKCLRQLFYRATKEPETNPGEVTGMLQAGFGDAIHYWLLNKLGTSGKIRLMKESGGKFIIDELTKEISYRVDGLVTVGDEMGGLELKTTQGRAITGKGWGIKDNGPKEDHLLQVICYMKAQPSLKWFALVYIGRDTAYRIQYNITRNGDEFYVNGKLVRDLNFAGVVSRWRELEQYIKDNKVPPRDFKVWLKDDGSIQETKTIKGDFYKSDFQCLYCPYSAKCWSEPDASKDAYR